jgi:hypothetical protein
MLFQSTLGAEIGDAGVIISPLKSGVRGFITGVGFEGVIGRGAGLRIVTGGVIGRGAGLRIVTSDELSCDAESGMHIEKTINMQSNKHIVFILSSFINFDIIRFNEDKLWLLTSDWY